MTYATMAKTTKLMPLKRHRRSQNPRVVYALVDAAMAVVDALMRISSRAEGEFGGRVLCLPQRLERRAQLGGEELRLLPRGEVSALGDLVEIDQVLIGAADP